jgi:hypothetical protein
MSFTRRRDEGNGTIFFMLASKLIAAAVLGGKIPEAHAIAFS